MPIYTYKCRECGRQFDKTQKVSEKKRPVCEVCGGATHRVFHPVGIIFKGSGFYKTDNRLDKHKANAPAKEVKKEEKTVPKKDKKDKKDKKKIVKD